MFNNNNNNNKVKLTIDGSRRRVARMEAGAHANAAIYLMFDSHEGRKLVSIRMRL